MHGVKRVVIFCVLIVVLPATLIIIPLYLRKAVFADVTYPVAESDIIEVRDGLSSIFCKQHSLRMSSNFNAFQLRSKPEISTNRKHIRLKKSMTLPDDTLEYWGFYLLKGAQVHLKFCSRYDGSRILVVKGQRNLKTCGLLDHNKNKVGANFAQGHEQVKVFFEDIKEITEQLRTPNELDASHNNQWHEDSQRYMELENHAGEDLSDNIVKSITNEYSINRTLFEMTTVRNSSNESNINMTADETTIEKTFQPNGTRKAERNKHHEHHNMQVATNHSAKLLTHTLKTADNVTTHATFSSLKSKRRISENELLMSKIYHGIDDNLQQVYDQLYKTRSKREHIYDRKYSHGGNAVNFTDTDESNSISSFENGLLECYNGDILLAEGFPPSAQCINAHFLENGSHRMLSKHEITEDGYYYYIFYSDNDLVRNDIHAIFDIYKPTFQYSNLSDSQGCVNATNCTFSIGFLSDEIVVVEVPTRDGIEHEEDDITHLISICHPRMEIYAIFPITVLLLILGCSFL